MSTDTPLDIIHRQFGPKVAALLTPEQQADAVQVFRLIADRETEAIARAWMIGQNPHLGDQPPILAIRDGRAHDVEGAARAYLDGMWT
ncbi:hypothetical protein [Streptomyces sp. NPDC006739]|uniref:hypothetical protein n=1 Tax=Streptomyces sp. NPDC006739 TaxID=3364763 RepID=UPI003678875C